MKLSAKYIFSLVFLFLLSISAFLIVLIKFEPCAAYSASSFCEELSMASVSLFFLTIFLSLTFVFSLMGFIGRYFIYKHEAVSRFFAISLRQGILLGIALTISIGLLSLKALRWWTLLLVFAVIILVEIYVLSKQET